MTITPDQALELLDGATPGPWRALHDQWEDEDGTRCEDFYVLGGTDGILYTEDFDPDTHNPVANTTLASAAPDLAQTIAGMRWQYGAQCGSDNLLIWRVRQEDAESLVASMSRIYPEGSCRLVRRLVGPVEVVE